MSVKKYLSLERLAEYDALLKEKIAQDDALVLDSAKAYVDQKFDGHTHSWNDLEDKPFGEEGSGAIITWDGDADALSNSDNVDINGSVYYKISDLVPTYDDLVGAEITVGDQSMMISSEMLTNSNRNVIYFGDALTFISDTSFDSYGQTYTAPSVGTYVCPDSWMAFSLSYGGGSSIKYLDEKYIPDTIARVSDIENIDLTVYETKEGAESKLAEAKSYADDKDTAIQTAQETADNAVTAAGVADEKAVKAQEDVDALKTYVGTIPTTATATDIVGYVQEKTSGIATSENLAELTNRVAEAETDIGNIQKDYLTSADKTELQENIDTVSSAVELLTNGVNAETVDGVNDLIAYVNEHGTEVTGMKADIQANADALAELAPVAKTGSWNDLEDKPFGEESSGATITWDGSPEGRESFDWGGTVFYKVSDKTPTKNDMVGASVMVTLGDSAPDTSMTLDRDTVDLIFHDAIGGWVGDQIVVSYGTTFTSGDVEITVPSPGMYWCVFEGAFFTSLSYGSSSIKTIDEKYIPNTIARVSDQDALTSRVTTAESDIDALETGLNDVSTAFGEYRDAHAGDYTNAQIDAAIKVVTDNVAALNDTYASDEELAQAIADEVSRANGAYAAKELETTVSEHKADTVAHITAAERTLWNASEQNAKDYADSLNGAMTTKVDGAIDRVAANETAIGNLNATVAGKVAQSDFDSVVNRIDALEDWHENFEEITAEYITQLFAQ